MSLHDTAFRSSSCVGPCYNYSSLSGLVAPNTSADCGRVSDAPPPPAQSKSPGGLHSSKHNIPVCNSLTASVVRGGCDSEAAQKEQLVRNRRVFFFFFLVVGHLQGTVTVSVMGPRDERGCKH